MIFLIWQTHQQLFVVQNVITYLLTEVLQYLVLNTIWVVYIDFDHLTTER